MTRRRRNATCWSPWSSGAAAIFIARIIDGAPTSARRRRGSAPSRSRSTESGATSNRAAPTPSRNDSSRSGSSGGSFEGSCSPHPALPQRGRETSLDLGGGLLGENRLDLCLGASDHVADAPLLLGIRPPMPGFAGYRAGKGAQVSAEIVHDAVRLRAPLGAPALLHPAEHFIDLRLALGHKGAAGIRDAVGLAPILLDGANVPHVLQHLEGRVDGARAGGVEAAEALLERLDQLVPVGGLVLEVLEDDVLEIAALEHLAPELVEAELTT